MVATLAVLEGEKKLRRKLQRLKGSTQRKIQRRAQSKASTPILRDAKKKCPTDTRALKKSLGRKTSTHKSGAVVTLIGPRRGHKDQATGRVPTRYAHLAERHTPYLRPAYDSNKDRAEQIIRDETWAGIKAEASK